MNKRLRKKKRLGEFREFGFLIGFRMIPGLSDADRNDLIDRFIDVAIEGNGLVCGGGGSDDEWEVFATSDRSRGSATEGQRKGVEEWLAREQRVVRYWVGPLVDAWRGEPVLPPAEDWVVKSG